MTPPSSKPSSSFETTPLYNSCLLDSQSHTFLYRLPRPLTPPSLPPAPAYLSCWWTGDSTDFWGHYLETTSPQFSEPLSSLCRRGSGKPTTAPMTQWREQFKKRKKIADPFLPLPIPAPHALLEPPCPLNPFPLLIPQSIHLPNWPAAQTHFLPADQTPFPLRNATEGTLLQLKEVGLKLTEEELRQWALDALLSPEDWKWLWEPAPVLTPSKSLTPPPPHPRWYNASSVNPPTMFAPTVLNTFAPSAGWSPQVTPNGPATCAPAPYVENSDMWVPVAQPQLQHAHPPPEWLTEGILESGSQSNDGGNVMVEDPPTSFSPFSLADCTMLSHFSFNNFVAIAFLDLAGDLDIQI